MKKIYFQDRYLLLCDEQAPQPDGYCQNLHVRRKSDMAWLVDRFLKTESGCTQLLVDDPKQGLKWLKDYFKFKRAAGGVVYNGRGEMLIIQRNGKWDLPKGHIENLESKKEAAVREVEEECGLKNIRLGEKLGTTWHIYPLQDRYALKKSTWYVMQVSGRPKLTPQTDEGITDARWVPIDKMDAVMANTWSSLLDVFQNLLSVPKVD